MKLQGVEAARGIAALLVVLLHASGFLSDPKDFGVQVFGGAMLFGRAGVDFFFVLSGFIITYVHANDLGRPAVFGLFWRKRLLRIYPTYWVVLAIYGALLAVSPTADRSEREPFHILASILLLPEQVAYPILGVAWSLRHEMLFYALFSLAVLHRKLGLAVLGAWLALIVFNLTWAMAMGRPYFTGIAGGTLFRVFNVQFFFGIAVALLIVRYKPWQPWAMLLAGVAIFFVNGMFESFGPRIQHEWPPRHLAYALGGAMAIYGLAALDRVRALHVPKPLLELGAASYSMYLIHGTALLILQQLLRMARPYLGLPLEVEYAIMVTTGVAAGVVFSRLIERPMIRAGNRLFVSERKAG